MTSIVELYASLWPPIMARPTPHTDDHRLRGGCACGRLVYRLRPAAIEERIGDELTVRPAGLCFVTGRPRFHRALDRTQLGFCRHCGTAMTRSRSGRLLLAVPTLDEPDELARIVSLRASARSAAARARSPR